MYVISAPTDNYNPRRPRNVVIPLEPNTINTSLQIQQHIQKKFGRIHFDIYPGTTQEFMQTLKEKWEEG